MTQTVEILPVNSSHKDQWQRLYAGYAAFYDAPLGEKGAETVWGWLKDPDHVFEGLVARSDGALVGLVHYRAMPSPLRASEIGFIDDLFVDHRARGTDAAEMLMRAVYRIGEERGWPLIRWITQDDNYRARGLYDRIGAKTRWNLYEMKFDPDAY